MTHVGQQCTVPHKGRCAVYIRHADGVLDSYRVLSVIQNVCTLTVSSRSRLGHGAIKWAPVFCERCLNQKCFEPHQLCIGYVFERVLMLFQVTLYLKSNLINSSNKYSVSRVVFLNRRAAARYRALASMIPGRERFSWNLLFYFSKHSSWINIL